MNIVTLRIRSGTPSGDLRKLFELCSMKLLPTSECRKPDGYLTVDKHVERYKNCPNVLFLGGFRARDNGQPRKENRYGYADHIVFGSKFYHRIVTSRKSLSNSSVIYTVGGLPSDSDMKPLLTPRKIDGPIQFIAIAKWWKRPYKRQRQTVRVFNRYLSKRYPGSTLHILGSPKPTAKKGNVIYYHKTFHKPEYIKIFKDAHVQLMLSPFDTGPVTLSQSLHYRVPFVCSNNCVGKEFIEILGPCGKMAKLDPNINSIRDCRRHGPMTNARFYDKELDYEKIVNNVEEIVDNFEEYTSWQWNDQLNYELQAQKWRALFER